MIYITCSWQFVSPVEVIEQFWIPPQTALSSQIWGKFSIIPFQLTQGQSTARFESLVPFLLLCLLFPPYHTLAPSFFLFTPPFPHVCCSHYHCVIVLMCSECYSTAGPDELWNLDTQRWWRFQQSWLPELVLKMLTSFLSAILYGNPSLLKAECCSRSVREIRKREKWWGTGL